MKKLSKGIERYTKLSKDQFNNSKKQNNGADLVSRAYHTIVPLIRRSASLCEQMDFGY